MSIFRAFALSLPLLTIAACQPVTPPPGTPAATAPVITAPTPAPSSPAPDLHSMPLPDAVALIKSKLRQNGQNLFCDQPAYLDCFHIAHAQCTAEMNSVKAPCLDKADAKFPAMQSLQELEQYSGEASACLAVQHAVLHPDKMREVSSCMQRIKFDPVQRDRSLFR